MNEREDVLSLEENYAHRNIPEILSDSSIPSQQDKVMALLKEVTLINRLYGNFKEENRVLSLATEGSLESKESESDQFLESMIAFARSAANIHLETSLNALNGIAILLLDLDGRPREMNLQSLAISSLCRVAIENSLIVLWDLEETNPLKMAERGLAEFVQNLGYLIDMEQMQSASRSKKVLPTSKPTPSEKLLEYQSKMNDLKLEGIWLGLATAKEVSKSENQVVGFKLNSPLPSYKEMCNKTTVGIYDSIDAFYSQLSGVIHGLRWSFEGITKSDDATRGALFAKRYIDLDFLVHCLMISIECTWRAHERYLFAVSA